MSRAVETGLVDDFLNPASREPAALVVEGEAGIGKTTMWLAILDRAREQGAQVLSARTAAAESALGYGVLADLLDGLDDSVLASLPKPQRIAMERILLQVNATGPITDQRAVAAGFLSVIEILAARGGLVLAIDDLQWLDASTEHVVGFAARRLSGAVRLLATVRTEPGVNTDTSWLQLPRPDAIQRIRMRPLAIGGLHAVISDRLGQSFARPTMKRIHEISGGNPFYALELARAMGDTTGSFGALPDTLTELVAARVECLDADIGEALLAAACVPAPTVELVARATGADTEQVARMLEDAEDKGIIGIDGQR
ncbi:MAG: hypothetical protein QOE20_4840, partial [Mycobacterium sp.]|nr:hypothetical protein [Mycobacterium sp.]